MIGLRSHGSGERIWPRTNLTGGTSPRPRLTPRRRGCAGDFPPSRICAGAPAGGCRASPSISSMAAPTTKPAWRAISRPFAGRAAAALLCRHQRGLERGRAVRHPLCGADRDGPDGLARIDVAGRRGISGGGGAARAHSLSCLRPPPMPQSRISPRWRRTCSGSSSIAFLTTTTRSPSIWCAAPTPPVRMCWCRPSTAPANRSGRATSATASQCRSRSRLAPSGRLPTSPAWARALLGTACRSPRISWPMRGRSQPGVDRPHDGARRAAAIAGETGAAARALETRLRDQGHPASGRTPSGRWSSAPTGLSSPTTAAVTSTARRPRSTCCRRLLRRWLARDGVVQLRHPRRTRRGAGARARRQIELRGPALLLRLARLVRSAQPM